MYSRIIFIVIALHFVSCDTDTINENNDKFNPCVTGIHTTTYSRPFGTGDILGNPSYYNDPFNYNDSTLTVVPNPLICGALVDPTDPRGSYPLPSRLTFAKLNSNIKQINIYKINYSSNPKDALVGSENLRRLQKELSPVYILNDPNYIDRWNWSLTDNEAEYVPSGFYRALVINNSEEIIKWFDIYIVQSFDKEIWQDPTGWLPPGWNK